MLDKKAKIITDEFYELPQTPIFKNLILLKIPPRLKIPEFIYFDNFENNDDFFFPNFFIDCRKINQEMKQKIKVHLRFAKKQKNKILKAMKKYKKKKIKNFYN